MSVQCVIYVLNAKIQKQRLKDMKNAARKRNLTVLDDFRDDITHLVTEFRDMAAVLRTLGFHDDQALHGVEVVSVQWFTDCMKAGKMVEVENRHRIRTVEAPEPAVQIAPQEQRIADYACQRITPLKHFNEKYSRALETLEKYAELRDSDQDYSRALAFRRASCVLKSLPHPLTGMHQIRNITHLGNHSKKIVQEILEEGHSEEVDSILQDPWFKHMKLFTGVFGIGPSKAKQFIGNGWSSIREVQDNYTTSDWRVQFGLAFYDDLTSPVTMKEANYITETVRRHLTKVLPGAIMKNTGGFSRGKSSGHDVDILMTHPTEHKVNGMLPRLLHSLQSHDMILCGKLEKSTYRDEVLSTNTKLTQRGQLDHFEKWIGIIKVPNKVRSSCVSSEDDKGDSKADTSDKETDTVSKLTKQGASSTVTTLYTREQEGVSYDSSQVADCEQTSDDKGVACDESNRNTRTRSISPNKEGLCDNLPAQEDGSDQVESINESFDIETVLNTKQMKEDPKQMAQESRDWTARRVDLIISPYSQYYYALVGWIGSKQFNRDIRTYAEREMNMKLSSHGLYDFNLGKKVPAGSEQAVFDNLRLQYRAPEDRNC